MSNYNQSLQWVEFGNPYIPVKGQPTCYKIVRNNQVVYVGKSRNLSKRLFSDHVQSGRLNKKTDTVFWVPIESEKHSLEVEKALIEEIRPVFNICGTNNVKSSNSIDYKRMGCKEGERRFTLIASEDKLEALANIAYWQRKTKKEALAEALDAYIQSNIEIAYKNRDE